MNKATRHLTLGAGGAAPDDALPFPGRGRFGETWALLLQMAESLRRIDPADFLDDFCGDETESWREVHEALAGVHHVAFYLGDYEDDRQVFDWVDFLRVLVADEEIRSVDMGPSYIAPKQYGTPGWWFSVTLPDGFVIEMFTCRTFGGWIERPPQERADLMSHLALAVESEPAVLAVMDHLVRSSESLESIALVERDEVGHTYCHIRNNRKNRVVEIVYDGDGRPRE